MVRAENYKKHFRVILRAYKDGGGANARRSVKGIAHVDVDGDRGDILLSVENLKYLGMAPNGQPYYYEGWLVLKRGNKVSLGPISVDAKGNGKTYWEFNSGNIAGTGSGIGDIAGFIVSVEMMDGNPYPSNILVLTGTLEEKGVKPPPQPVFPKQPYVSPYQSPVSWMSGYGDAGVPNPGISASMPTNQYPYSWWQMQSPGVRHDLAFLFGLGMGNTGIERVAFGFSGSPDQPVSPDEAGNWQATGINNPQGYWIYYREPQL
jgi:hypothetical protein